MYSILFVFCLIDNGTMKRAWQRGLDSSRGAKDKKEKHLNNNTVTGTDANEMNDSVKAYYMANNIQLQVGCNAATDIGRGYEFFHNNLGTFWHDNDMTNNNKGYVLNNSYIGPQGSSPFNAILDHWQSTWASPHWQTFVIGSPYASSSPLHVVNSATDNPLIIGLNSSSPFVPSHVYSWPGAILLASPSINNICKTTNTSGVGGLGKPGISGLDSFSNGDTSGVQPDYEGFEAVAKKSVPYQEDSAVRTWIAQYGVWQYMNNTPDSLQNSAILNSFYQLASQSRYAYLTNIESALVDGDIQTAQKYLANPTLALVGNGVFEDPKNGVIIADDKTSDYIVANYQTFYHLYLNYNNEILTAEDSAAIITMAELCPGIYGTVVYQARTLYSAVWNDLIVWNDDNCYTDTTGNDTTNNGGRYSKNKGGLTQNNAGQQYSLYPNPNDGDITLLQLLADNKPVSIKVMNILGETIFKENLVFNQNTLNLQLVNIIAGMYSLNLLDSQGRIFIFKFVIR